MPTTVPGMLKMIWKHPANRGRQFRAMGAMAGWQARKRLLSQPFDIDVYDGMRFRAHHDSSQVGRFKYFGGLPDFEAMTFMRRYLRSGDGFIDGGANEGMYSLLAGQLVGASGEVHAFEAVPVFLDRLRHNLAMNGMQQVTVHAEAIGERAGSAEFVIRGVGSRIKTAHDIGETLEVSVVALDSALPDREWAMGKLDLEGGEHVALRGAERLLARNQPAIWMLEAMDHMLARFGSDVGELRVWLQDHGYEPVLYDVEANRLHPVPTRLWPLADMLAVNRDRRAEVEARLTER
jgi:FkbM family methyltransferase